VVFTPPGNNCAWIVQSFRSMPWPVWINVLLELPKVLVVNALSTAISPT